MPSEDAMTEISARLILASKNAATGDVVYTFVLTYPRMILSEFNTHRAFSRNTSSSRAIPGKRQRGRVVDDPFVPSYIGASKKGMQAGDELTGWRRKGVELIWRGLRYPNVWGAWAMEKLGAHKQISNRVVEPWVWVEQIATMTDLDNFFRLRKNDMAEPHFHDLAKKMQRQVELATDAFNHASMTRNKSSHMPGGSWAQILQPGELHLPFVDAPGWVQNVQLWQKNAKKISTARCARVSYNLPDTGKPSTPEKDYQLHNSLFTDGHMSPFEHVATAMDTWQTRCPDLQSNLRGFLQYRRELERKTT